MRPEQTRKLSDLGVSSSEVMEGQSREEREKSFSRRALLHWSLPAAAMAIGALSGAGAKADPYSDSHEDYEHADWYHDHTDGEDPHHDHHGDQEHDDHNDYLDSPYQDHWDGGSPHQDEHSDYWDSPPPHTDTPYVNHDDHADVHDDHSDHIDTPHGDEGIHGDSHTDHTDQGSYTDVAHVDEWAYHQDYTDGYVDNG